MLLDKPYLFEQFPNFNSFQQCPAYFIFRFTCSNAIGTNSNHGAAQGDRHNHADNKPEQDKMKSAPKTQASFFFFRKSFAGIPRKNFVSMGVQGCLLFVISAMILVALEKQ